METKGIPIDETDFGPLCTHALIGMIYEVMQDRSQKITANEMIQGLMKFRNRFAEKKIPGLFLYRVVKVAFKKLDMIGATDGFTWDDLTAAATEKVKEIIQSN